MRNKIMGQSTPQQSQVADDIANAIINNDQINQSSIERNISTSKTDQRNKDYQNRLILNYTHEKRLAFTKRDMHRIYKDVFANTPAMDVKIIVGNRNRRAANNDLIRKRPLKSLLKNKPFKSKHFLKRHRLQ